MSGLAGRPGRPGWPSATLRVCARNGFNDQGDYCQSKKAETRYGNAVGGLAAVGGFVASTVTAPLITGAGAGIVAGEAASYKADSKAGKAVARTAAGIAAGLGAAALTLLTTPLSAPTVGAAGAYAAYKGVTGDSDCWSNQSDEEGMSS